MSNLLKIIRNYFSSENTNIFRNYKDALAGAVVMIGMPIVSVFMAVFVEQYTFWNYTFPLLSIALAGLYDTYGRYEEKSPKNTKLAIRIIFDLVAIFFAALSIGIDNKVLPYISPGLLLVCGLFLSYEIYNRVRMAIWISPWGI